MRLWNKWMNVRCVYKMNGQCVFLVCMVVVFMQTWNVRFWWDRCVSPCSSEVSPPRGWWRSPLIVVSWSNIGNRWYVCSLNLVPVLTLLHLCRCLCVCVFFCWDRNIRVTRVEFVHMCLVKLVRVVCLLTSGWNSTLISSHNKRRGAVGAKGDHTHWLGSVGHLLGSLIGSIPGMAASLRLLHCSIQSMSDIIRTVVRSSPIDAMRSSYIILCSSTTVVVV